MNNLDNYVLVLRIKYFTIGFAVMAVLAVALLLHKIPHCNEDVTLIGIGQFDSGRWSQYECGPAVDDYIR